MFSKSYNLDSGKVITKSGKSTQIALISTFIFIIFTIISLYATNFDLFKIISRSDKLFVIIKEMFSNIITFEGGISFTPYFLEKTVKLFPEIILTVNMAFLGTLIGAIFAFFIAFLSAKNTNHQPVVRTSVRIFMTLVRTLPVLIYAIILTYIFGIGEFAGIIAIIIFTVGILAKMFYEFIETVSMNPSEAAIAAGASNLKSTERTVVPQVIPQYISMVLYAFEINVRAATILGFVGAGGIGQLIKDDMATRKYAEVGVIILWIFIIVLIIDGVSNYIRRRLING